MPSLEDSGIESEDKASHTAEEQELEFKSRNSAAEHMADLEITFKRPTLITTGAQSLSSSPNQIISNLEEPPKIPNTCRILQRKLELKVERAKRNYSFYQETNKRKSQSATLIPINRLSIPGELEKKPLVDYISDSDDCAEDSFFPDRYYKGRSERQSKLSDTFSIQEMTIDSDLESNDSQSLELLPPHIKKNFLDYLAICLCFHSTS